MIDVTYVPFIKWRLCPHCRQPECPGSSVIGKVRLFTEPLGPMQTDGMPVKGWLWGCDIIRQDNAALLIEAAETAPPPGSRPVLIQKAIELGTELLRWERSEEHGLVIREFPLTTKKKI